MQYSEGTIGRVFTLRLEDNERVPGCIEQFAKNHNIRAAFCTLIGGIDNGTLITGPENGDAPTIKAMHLPITNAHEVAGLGTLFPNESGEPVLHMHAALGRDGKTHTGCIRPGLDVWLIGEVIIMEILNTDMLRKEDTRSGFELLTKG
ncbi:PPC domain-containing DNA-binding protein [Pseudodesulfovibrio sediminis]|uniref:DNA-binding protein n=1 Tax=Pseudodesulfovibrio sediminis TaxID=2810563 RepID=A0ABM7P2A2_9BACT|nr:PPC domain-containing DNA-binding protein [Pseudodesulfovibrio sediminis]BCS86932.1 DNA-binding protein [Pseudodesulfovibrio sediminis]